MQPTAQPRSRRTLDNDEIRLLIYDKEQSQRSGLLTCRTSIVRLFDVNTGAAVPYAALSYVWGSAATTKLLICDEVEVQVTMNLQYALSVIWAKYPEIRLWADALSITQDNLSERNHQVSLMGRIFRSAIRVFVSLGPPLKGDNRFWNALQTFNPHKFSTKATSKVERNESFQSLCYKLGVGLDDLIRRPWFRRAWTYQEIRLAVAAEVFCGDSSMPWDDFVDKLSHSNVNIFAINRDGPLSLPAFLKQQGLMFKQRSAVRTAQPLKEKLLELLLDGWPRDASDPRDKIYAFTSSLLASSSYVELRPDYTLDTRSTFIRLIRVLINNENNLEFLKYARGVDEPIQSPDGDVRDHVEGMPLKVRRLTEGHLSTPKDRDDPAGSLEAEDLPSWTCDWRRRGLRARFGRVSSDVEFQVRQNVRPLRQSVHDFDNRLVLRGAALARVGHLQKGTTEYHSQQAMTPGSTFSRLPRCALHRASSKSTTSIPQYTEMWRRDVQSGKKSLTASNMVVLLLQTLLHDQTGCECSEALEQDLLKARYPYDIYPRSCARHLDWLFLLDGCGEPVILRPNISPGETESSRSEIGFAFVSLCPLVVKFNDWREWHESPFAYGEIALY